MFIALLSFYLVITILIVISIVYSSIFIVIFVCYLLFVYSLLFIVIFYYSFSSLVLSFFYLTGITFIVIVIIFFIVITCQHLFSRSYLCGDFVYVMLFPQLTLAVHAPNYVNTYGSICGYVLGFILRILGNYVTRGFLNWI